MKKIICKILIIFILIITVFEFVCSSNISNANIISEESLNTVSSLAGGVVSIVYWDKRLLATGLAFVLDNIVANLAEADGVNYGYSGPFSIITPFDIFFNKYKLLDVNFFDITGVPTTSIAYTIRTAVAQWFYVMRLVASAILLVILVYVGIRMAISSVAEEKAKYKKMLVDWCCSLLLIFVLQYIAIFTIYCNNAIVNALASVLTDKSVEDSIGSLITGIGVNAVIGVGIPSIISVLVFCAIVFQSLAFLVAYISRMIKVGFLIIISPLISLTYSIDKMGDGKAQALGTWLKEFVYTILIQPFHCILYIAFIRTAFSLIVKNTIVSAGLPAILSTPEYNQLVNGVLAILCIKFVSDGEKIIRQIFGFQDDNSSTSFVGGMAVGMMAIKNAQKIGTTTRKGINFAKNKAGSVSKAFSHDGKMWANNNWVNSNNALKRGLGNLGKGAGNLEQKLEKGTKALGDKLGNSMPARGLKRGINGARTLSHKYRNSGFGKAMANRRFSTSSAVGLMAGSMAYMAGGMGALEAFGLGKGVAKGSAELLNSSTGKSTKNLSDLNYEQDKKEEKELAEDIAKDEKALADTEKQTEFGKLMDESKVLDTEADTLDSDADKLEKDAEELEAEASKERQNADSMFATSQAAGGLVGEEAEEQALESMAKAKKLQDEADAKKARAEALRTQAVAKREESEGGKQLAKALDEEYDGRLKSIYSSREKYEESVASKKKELSEFYAQRNVKQRIRDRSRGASSAELQSKKMEIMSLLSQMKAKSKDGEGLTEAERTQIETTAEWITENITDEVQNGRGFDLSSQTVQRQIKHSIGIHETPKGDEFKGLEEAASDYKSLQLNLAMSSIFEEHGKYNGDADLLTSRTAKVVESLGNQKKKQK